MSLVINGSGSITGLAVGGLPDGTVDAGTLATDSVTAAKLEVSAITATDLPAGSVIQVVSADIGALTTSSSQSFVDTNASIAITPQFSNSKILATFTFAIAVWGQARARGGYRLLRGSTVISGGATEVIQIRDVSGDTEVTMPVSLSYLDSPSSTSATTYKVQIVATSSGGNVQMVGQGNTRPGNMILMEIAG